MKTKSGNRIFLNTSSRVPEDLYSSLSNDELKRVINFYKNNYPESEASESYYDLIKAIIPKIVENDNEYLFNCLSYSDNELAWFVLQFLQVSAKLHVNKYVIKLLNGKNNRFKKIYEYISSFVDKDSLLFFCDIIMKLM